MFLIDFNGNGMIDPTDIALSLAMSEEETEDEYENDDDEDISGNRRFL